jgi:predicted site-specific integrase-resolvase
VSVPEVQQAYSLSRSTIYRLVRAGQLTLYRRAGDRRSYVERDRVEALVRFREHDPQRT